MRKDIYEWLKVLKMDEIKPNFAELAKAWDVIIELLKSIFIKMKVNRQ